MKDNNRQSLDLHRQKRGNLLSAGDIEKMAREPIIRAMANPVAEIMPDIAKKAGAAVIGTGRSDFPNQVNNVLVFPGMVCKPSSQAGRQQLRCQGKAKSSMKITGVN